MSIPATNTALPKSWHFMFRTLSNRNFRLFFIGQSISFIGTWSQVLAISWLVWKLTDSTWWLGFINFATQIPIFLLGLIGGYIADRYTRLPIMLLTQILCLIQALALAILAYLNIVELWHIVILSFSIGIVYAFEFPLRQSFVMDMVGKKHLLSAIALNSTAIHSTRILGPVLAGIIIAWKGEKVCFLVNAFTYLCFIIILVFIDRDLLYKQDKGQTNFKKAIMEGFNYILKTPIVKTTLLVVTIISGSGIIFMPLLPVFAEKVYGGSAADLGVLTGSLGFGSLIGGLFLARKNKTDGLLGIIIKAAIGFSFFIIIFAWQTHQYVAMFFLSISGFFLTILFASANTLLQYCVPNHLRGRMVSLFVVTFFGLLPITSIIGGAVAEVIGVRLTVAIGGLIGLIMGVVLFFRLRNHLGGSLDGCISKDSQVSEV